MDDPNRPEGFFFAQGKIQLMAIEQDIQRIKDLTNGAAGYTDEQIKAVLESGVTIRQFCYDFWTRKATEYSALVNVSESGSSRNMGDLYKNALAIADRFRPLDEVISNRQNKVSRRATRG